MPVSRSLIKRAALATTVFALACGVASADIDGHPHLRAADAHAAAAIAQMQRAHNGDDWFGGHRVRAIQLLRDAQVEMHRAAIYADRHHG